MKLQIQGRDLADLVAAAARALPGRPPVPVLAGLLLTADPVRSTLTVAGTDWEVSTQSTGPADIKEPGTVLVSGRLLTDIAQALPKAATLGLNATGPRMLLTGDGARFTLPTLPVEEYPALPAIPPVTGGVDGQQLADAVAQVVVAAATDTAVPVLTAIHITVDLPARRLTLAATDRYRMAIRHLPLEAADPPALPSVHVDHKKKTKNPVLPGVLWPARSLAAAVRLTVDQERVQVSLGDDLGALSAPGTEFTTRLMSGDFPNWRNHLPQDADNTVTATTGQLLEVVQRVALVTTTGQAVRMELDADKQLLRLFAGSGDDAQAVDTIAADITGPEAHGLQAAFNPGFLATALKAQHHGKVRIHLSEPHRPCLITGVTADGEADDTYLTILMPIRINA
ncbi:DNA polymerase III subunit beta [Streptacidiphilus sp. N1-12]|uniref:Beta sliding clamp n=1 Tax=Streptacidiphilus alkalitolerans TaxID=3342712 RepID=A0ABV6WSH9_9ACTN